MATAAVLSFRLGGTDGVSIEAAKWGDALSGLGLSVTTIAGSGPVDVLLPGLAMGATEPPSPDTLESALADADLVVVENLCSLPLNPVATRVVASALRDRPAVLHHHDLPWQRPNFATAAWDQFVPDDPAWAHVTINELSRVELAQRGIAARVIRNAFDTEAPPGDRHRTRVLLGLLDSERLALLPSRALLRKNVPAALALSEALGAVFWLLGPAEDGYDDELSSILARASVRVIHGDGGTGATLNIADAYAAADLVVFPSTWEGFGNPAVESAVHRRPLAIGDYPVARELARFGFRWFPTDDPEPARRYLDAPTTELIDHNQDVARRFFSLDRLAADLSDLLERSFWKSTLS